MDFKTHTISQLGGKSSLQKKNKIRNNSIYTYDFLKIITKLVKSYFKCLRNYFVLPCMSELLYLHLTLMQYTQTMMHSKLTLRKFISSVKAVDQEPQDYTIYSTAVFCQWW